MDNQALKESILKAVNNEVNEWVDKESTIKDPLLYESRLLERALKIGRVMLENSGGKLPKDRNAKKKY